MLDIQFIRDNAGIVEQKSRQKGYQLSVSGLLELDDKRRLLQTEINELRRQRNELSGAMKGRRPSDTELATGRQLKEKLSELEDRFL